MPAPISNHHQLGCTKHKVEDHANQVLTAVVAVKSSSHKKEGQGYANQQTQSLSSKQRNNMKVVNNSSTAIRYQCCHMFGFMMVMVILLCIGETLVSRSVLSTIVQGSGKAIVLKNLYQQLDYFEEQVPERSAMDIFYASSPNAALVHRKKVNLCNTCTTLYEGDVDYDLLFDQVLSSSESKPQLLVNVLHWKSTFSVIVMMSGRSRALSFGGLLLLLAVLLPAEVTANRNIAFEPSTIRNLQNTAFTVFDLPGGTMWTRSIVAADVNGDGNLDILVGNDGQTNQLLLNDGNGSFAEANDLPGGTTNSYSIVAADVNNDGNLDILVGNWQQSIQLLLNDGNGKFTEAINLPGGTMNTWSIVVADVNNDGNLDILIGNAWGQTNQLLLNDGNGSFTQAKSLPGGTMDTRSIVAADVNGDGNLDILVGNDGQTNQLLLNDGNGSFAEANDLPGGTMRTSSIVAADVNGDGNLDILVGNLVQTNQLLLNEGNGKLTEANDLPGGIMLTISIEAADVNNDGNLDILIGNDGQTNQLLLNDGNGKFTEADDLPGGSMYTVSIVAADVNGDGNLDILVGNRHDQTNQLLLSPTPVGVPLTIAVPSAIGVVLLFIVGGILYYRRRDRRRESSCSDDGNIFTLYNGTKKNLRVVQVDNDNSTTRRASLLRYSDDPDSNFDLKNFYVFDEFVEIPAGSEMNIAFFDNKKFKVELRKRNGAFCTSEWINIPANGIGRIDLDAILSPSFRQYINRLILTNDGSSPPPLPPHLRSGGA